MSDLLRRRRAMMEKLRDVEYIEIPLPSLEAGWVDGFLNANAGISTATSHHEMTSPPIEVQPGRKFQITISHKEITPTNQWYAHFWCTANKARNGTRFAQLGSRGIQQSFVFTVPEDRPYIQFSIRTFETVQNIVAKYVD